MDTKVIRNRLLSRGEDDLAASLEEVTSGFSSSSPQARNDRKLERAEKQKLLGSIPVVHAKHVKFEGRGAFSPEFSPRIGDHKRGRAVWSVHNTLAAARHEIGKMKKGDEREAVIVDNSSGHHKGHDKYIVCY